METTYKYYLYNIKGIDWFSFLFVKAEGEAYFAGRINKENIKETIKNIQNCYALDEFSFIK